MELKSLVAMAAVAVALALAGSPVARAAKRRPRTQAATSRCARTATRRSGTRSTSRRTARRTTPTAACARPATATPPSTSRIRRRPSRPIRSARATRPTSGRRSASTCHSGNRNLAFWTSGKHQLNEVTCANCHSIHGRKALPELQRAESAGQVADDQQVHDDVPAEPGGDLLAVPPADPRGELQAVASPDHRRQGQVLRLPQPARRDHAGDAEAADDQRPVLLVPRRQARSVRVQPPAGRGELRDLPQPARLGPREAPERVGAEPVPGLPRRVAAPRHDLRRGRRVQLPAGRHLRDERSA